MRKIGYIVLLCLILTACTLYQKPKTPPAKIPRKFKYQYTNHRFIKDAWWENFNDERLNQLVATALKNNYNYRIALKNIDIAKTYVTQNESALFPQANLNFNTSRTKTLSIFSSENFIKAGNPAFANTNAFFGIPRIFNLQQLFTSVSYELDIWNQIGNTVNQAYANVGVNFAESNVIKLTLISNVVNTYFQIEAINENLSNLQQQYKINYELTHYYKTQFLGKLIDVTTVNDAKNQAEATKINIKMNEKQREILINTLAYLLGLYREEFKFKNQYVLKKLYYTHLIPAGIPAIVIANRPDVQSAYFQILSYGYLEKQTIANFLPSFNLTGTYGYANTGFSKFFRPYNAFWDYGLSFLEPVFDYKLRLSEYRRAQYQYQSAILNYKNKVINALQEVDNALLSFQKDMTALHAYQREIINSTDRLNVALAQFQSGYGDYSTFLNYKLMLLQNHFDLINQRLLLTQDVVQVYKTMGLGLCF